MWNCESNKFDSDNINAFKDLKIFDTLEPEKVETFENNNVKTALLVDISDSDNSDTKLVGSFLDVKKKEFNFIDLYENLYVTPQHVANKNDLEQNWFDLGNTDTSKLTYDDNGESSKEIRPCSEKEDTLRENRRTFDEIFDSAVSSRYSIVEFKSENVQSEDTVDEFTIGSQTHLYNRPVKVLTPPISNYNIEPPEVNTTNVTALHLDDNFHFEPNINKINNTLSKEIETLTIEVPHKKVNKQCNEDINILRPPIYDNISKPSSVETTNITPLSKDVFTIERNDKYAHNKKDCDVNVLNNSNDVFNSKLSKVNTNNIHPIYEAQKPAGDTFVDIFKVPRVEIIFLKQNENTSKRNVFESDPVTRYRKEITSSLVDLNKPPIVLTNREIPVLQTVKKDTKAFNKRRIVKKDIEKIGFTKGPDIYEKSVVLPQIMQRLGERRKCLDARNNVKRKLVLDKGIKDNIVIPKLSPEVLMEDCNKERLKALKLRTAFEKFVMSGHF
ncbi:unnamed protein product [Euphydryas editha]|uniref:Uncharacterized protein n=1 Tax=Euphydryas editha TaxID=104508 RepID=A0AAU9TBK4_EUPED|nr:unnamed protein product [Euphydryas editha]